MEKIYMNNQKNQKQSFFQQLFNSKCSVVLTIAIACIGIMGLVAFGFNQISFAVLDKTGASLDDEFVSAHGGSDTRVIGASTIQGHDSKVFAVDGFFANLDNGPQIPIFCIEYNIDFVANKEYVKGQEITDQGLIYLMSQLYPNKMLVDQSGTELDERVQVWLTQTAIWTYLYETGDPNNSKFAENVDLVRNVTYIYDSAGDTIVEVLGGNTLFGSFGINDLINQAKQYRQNPFTTLSVNKKSETVSITNDNKFYQSDEVSVVGSTSSPLINSFESYSVTINNAPEGTVIVKQDGTAYTADELKNMTPTSKFYVRVPVDKVTEELKKVEISVLGNFKMYGANKYTSENWQKVANVGILNKSQSVPLNIQLDYTPAVGDTGMSVAQIVYFIGLIVLLTGVGIIYVNAKPAEIKQ